MPALQCKDVRALMDQAIDDELAQQAADVGAAFAAHLDSCPDCKMELAGRRAMVQRRQSGLDRFTPSRDFKARLLASLPDPLPSPAPRRPVPWWRAWVGHGLWAAGGAVLAVSLMFFSTLRLSQDDLAKELVAAHVRSLMVNHLTDVPSSDQHTVKPWFNGRVDLSPPVPDLADQGFPLVGGRLDYIHERRVAALVYRRRQHLINLFVWPDAGSVAEMDRHLQRHGYNIVLWRQNGVVFAIVSDVNAQDIESFRQLWLAQAIPKE